MSECVVYWLHDAYCTHVQKHGYVGISVNFWRRLARHQKDKRFPPFDWSIIYIGTREKCLALEADLRPTWGIGWNKAEGGESGCGTWPKSEEHKVKMSVAAKERYTDPKERELAKEYQIGKHDHRGKNNPRYGITMSDETKKNISVGRTGKALGNQNWKKRKPDSEETSRKKSEASKASWANGRIQPPWSAARRLAWLKSKEN